MEGFAAVSVTDDFNAFMRHQDESWLREMCELVGVAAPSDFEERLDLARQTAAYVIPRVRSAFPEAVEGKANEALLVYLAAVLAVRRSQVAIRRGMRSRDKLITVEGLSSHEATERLTAATGRRQPRLMDDVREERSEL